TASAQHAQGLWDDVLMMVLLGGRERTAEQYERLLGAAGLHLGAIVPVGPGLCVIECALQPPKRKPPHGSSGPPGAWLMPSRDWRTAPVSLRFDPLARGSRLDRGDIDLLHLHHRLERALAPLTALVHQIGEPLRCDLPGK